MDDVTVNVTPNEGATFSYLEINGTNQGSEFVLVDNNGVATFHIRGLQDEAGSNYYGNTIVAVCDEEMGEAPVPDEPQTPNNDDQSQCSTIVVNYIVDKVGTASFQEFYQNALNYYNDYLQSGMTDFVQWFSDKWKKGIESNLQSYINNLLAEGFTYLDILTVWEFDNRQAEGLVYTFERITSEEKTYNRCVVIDFTIELGVRQTSNEYLKCGFAGEKTIINGIEMYVADAIDNHCWVTRDKGGIIQRRYTEPGLPSQDGKFYFKTRTTKSLDDVYVVYRGITHSIASLIQLESGRDCKINIFEYSGEDVTASEMVAERFEGCTKQANAIMNKISNALSNGNIGKARDCAYGLELCYKGIERMLKEYL